MSGAASSSGGGRVNVPWWAITAAAVPTVAAGLYWLSWKSYDVIPVKYQYIPGTVTGWLANLLTAHSKWRRQQRPVRIYMDGCFDMMHYGHANALRQAKKLGDVLVVGLIPDSEIQRCKGPPVMNDTERGMLIGCVKWVDEVLCNVPYDLTPDFLDELFTKHRIDYVIHGDDPCLLPDGTDAYAHAKKLGRFRMIKRTEGVSTTDVVGRMLMCATRNPFVTAREAQKQKKLQEQFRSTPDTSKCNTPTAVSVSQDAPADGEEEPQAPKFLPTSRRLVQFSSGRSAPPGARIVYIDGAFDVFHCGHVSILKQAQKKGDFLLVGIHSDEAVQARRGPHLPIMGVHERALSVLACKYADEVVIGAPTEISEDLIKTFNISVVVRGNRSERSHLYDTEESRYQVAKDLGIYQEIDSDESMTANTIIQRIYNNKTAFEERQAKKMKSEANYYANVKGFVAEQ